MDIEFFFTQSSSVFEQKYLAVSFLRKKRRETYNNEKKRSIEKFFCVCMSARIGINFPVIQIHRELRISHTKKVMIRPLLRMHTNIQQNGS